MADPRIDNTPDDPSPAAWSMGWEPAIDDPADLSRSLKTAAEYYDSLATDRMNAVSRDLSRAEMYTADVQSGVRSDVAGMLSEARTIAADVTGAASGAVSDDVARIFGAVADLPGADVSPESVVAASLGVPYVAPVGQGGPSATSGPGAIPGPFTGQPASGTPVVPGFPASPTTAPVGGAVAGQPITNLPGQQPLAAGLFVAPDGFTYFLAGQSYGPYTGPGSWGNGPQGPNRPEMPAYQQANGEWVGTSYGLYPSPWAGPVPTTTTPPPPPPDPTCIKICGLDELIEALTKDKEKECEPTRYKLWCREGEGLILTAEDAEQPPGTELVASGVPSSGWFKLGKDCLDKDKEEDEEDEEDEDEDDKPPERPPVAGAGPCEADINVPLVFGRPSVDGAIAAVVREIVVGDTATAEAIAGGGIAGAYAIFKGLYTFPYSLLKAFVRPYQAMLDSRNCDAQPLVGLGIMSFFGGVASKYFAVYAPWFNRPIEQSTNYHCPTEVPSPAEAASAYLGNTIDEQTLECWVRMGGSKYPHFRRVIESQQSKLSMLEAVNALRRGKMNDAEFAAHCRKLGYLDNNIPEIIKDITVQIPVLSDILRFMVRDAGDDVLAQKLGTDSLFAQKYSGQLKDWADQQGIDPDYAKYAWRSHWSIPSPTQLYEMLHRLRFSDIDPNVRVSEKDIEDALIQDDKLPYWVPKFMAISYRVPGRIDIKRAYSLGVWDEFQVMRAFQELGYNDKNADVQTQSTIREVGRSRLNLPIVKQFIRGEVGLPQLETYLNAQRWDTNTIGLVIDHAINQREIARVAICLRSIRKGFLQGQYDVSQLRVELSKQSISPEHADELVSRWGCEKASRDRQATAAMLAGWYLEGSLDDVEYYTRLRNLGWNATDSQRMIESSRSKVNARTEKETKLRLRAEEMEREKNARQLEKTAKQAAANEAKRKREAESAESERAKFGVRILSAAEKLSAKTGEELHVVRDWIHGQVYGRFATSPLTPLEVVQAAQTVSELPTVTDRETWLAAYLPLVSA